MTMLKLSFAGFITKAEHKQAGSKSLIELSICKKNRVKEGDPEAFTWIRVAVWECPEFLVPKLVKGAFVAGSGDMTLRSYVNKDGAKAVSCEVRCSGYDIESGVPKDGAPAQVAQSAPVPAAKLPGAASPTDDEPPF